MVFYIFFVLNVYVGCSTGEFAFMTIVEDVGTVCKKYAGIFEYEGLIYTLFINPISLYIYYDYKYLTKK